MSRPEDLRQAAENMLYGLKADDTLKYRIIQKASVQPKSQMHLPLRAAPVLFTVLTVFLIAVIGLNSIQSVSSAVPGEIKAFAAGKTESGMDSLFPAEFRPDSVISIRFDQSFPIQDAGQCTALASVLCQQAVRTSESDGVLPLKLIISTSDGKEYCFGMQAPYLEGDDGIRWSCPAFFDEIENIIK